MAGAAALLLLGLPCTADAQGVGAPVRLVGEVVDATSRRPLPGVRLAVRELGVVTVTDSIGRFVLEVPRRDAYRVELQQLGFRSELVTVGAVDGPLVLTLSPDPLVLQGLDVVVAEQGLRRVLREQETRRRGYTGGSVRLVSRERLARSAAASARDELMSHIPGAVECNAGGMGSLCLGTGRRRGPIKICIDGVRALGGAADLRAYAPAELYSVEVYKGGALVLVYTNRYMERAMTHSVFVQPFPELVC